MPKDRLKTQAGRCNKRPVITSADHINHPNRHDLRFIKPNRKKS